MESQDKVIESLTKTIEIMTNELTLLREQVEYLRQKLYGKSSEKVVYQPGQPVPELDQWNDLRAVMGDDGVLRIFKEKNSDDFC